MKKIAIIGAGISGLFFANLLKNKSNYDFTIFEKKKLVDVEDGKLKISSETILEIHEFIKYKGRSDICKQAAHSGFDVNMAIDKYYNLYGKLLDNLHV